MRFYVHIDGESSPRAIGYPTVAQAIAAAHALGYQAGSYWVIPMSPQQPRPTSVIEFSGRGVSPLGR